MILKLFFNDVPEAKIVSRQKCKYVHTYVHCSTKHFFNPKTITNNIYLQTFIFLFLSKPHYYYLFY
uniref:Uncharacterized protein n=1 Tax=Meloidogyne enterolobii TaxID=390850 RepID=A0A6V7VAF3_MELEN|nr:unnamed protein product [Meloidogyne enterolobii]